MHLLKRNHYMYVGTVTAWHQVISKLSIQPCKIVYAQQDHNGVMEIGTVGLNVTLDPALVCAYPVC